MKKLSRFFRFLAKILSNFWVRLALLFGVMIAICAACGAFSSAQSFGQKITEVLTSGDILLTFLIAAVSLIVARVTMVAMSKLEDSYKLESDQKKIIIKYSDHKLIRPATANFYTPDGALMYLSFPPKQARRRPRNPEKKHTEEHDLYENIITHYMIGADPLLQTIQVPTMKNTRCICPASTYSPTSKATRSYASKMKTSRPSLPILCGKMPSRSWKRTKTASTPTTRPYALKT